jgi:hypothetical protein
MGDTAQQGCGKQQRKGDGSHDSTPRSRYGKKGRADLPGAPVITQETLAIEFTQAKR